jgi:hypothetical protein
MSINDITGDAIATRVVTDAYRNNYDSIFGKKKPGRGETECLVIVDDSPFIETEHNNQETQSPFNTINS